MNTILAELKLTPAQWRLLDRICKTNGGGVFSGFNEGDRNVKMMRALEAMGFVQGKAGAASRAVHTRDGLAYWRKHKKPD